MEKTIFHKFANGELRPDKVLFEDNELLAFDSIHPATPVHVLIIPKKEILSIADMQMGDELIVGKMIYRAKLLAEELGIDHPGYRVAFNVREGGGQSIPYLHLHLLGGVTSWGDKT